MKVLIVEENPVSALLLRKVLDMRGYEVHHAKNGREALSLSESDGFRIVISDWMMPEMDGVALCQKLRERAEAYIYVILLSAKSEREDRLRAFEAGVDDFLGKPLDKDELFARLKVAERIIEAEEGLNSRKIELELASEKLLIANGNLVVASRRFEELFDGLPAACFTFDEKGLVHEWNRAAEELFEIPSHLAMLQGVLDLLKGNDGLWTPELISQVFEGQSKEGVEWAFMTKSGAERLLVCNIFPLRGPNGEILGAISANVDVTERRLAHLQIEEQMVQINEIAYSLEQQKEALEEANARLELLAVTDGLTGLWNHRRFREELELRYAEHRRMGQPFSVMMIDVDHFKQYNDSFGHPAGDAVLKEVAKVLSSICRSHESVARYGGEEFAVVLTATTSEQALQAAERFRKGIADRDWPMRAITVSIGVATTDPALSGPNELLANADAALYRSKQTGRNRATRFDEPLIAEAA
ncbi:MAG: diguanylate cyclase [Fimbriimonadaceae bacterium]